MESINAHERRLQAVQRLANRITEARILAVHEFIIANPERATSAKRIARGLGIARHHVEAALTVLHFREHVIFDRGRTLAA